MNKFSALHELMNDRMIKRAQAVNPQPRSGRQVGIGEHRLGYYADPLSPEYAIRVGEKARERYLEPGFEASRRGANILGGPIWRQLTSSLASQAAETRARFAQHNVRAGQYWRDVFGLPQAEQLPAILQQHIGAGQAPWKRTPVAKPVPESPAKPAVPGIPYPRYSTPAPNAAAPAAPTPPAAAPTAGGGYPTGGTAPVVPSAQAAVQPAAAPKSPVQPAAAAVRGRPGGLLANLKPDEDIPSITSPEGKKRWEEEAGIRAKLAAAIIKRAQEVNPIEAAGQAAVDKYRAEQSAKSPEMAAIIKQLPRTEAGAMQWQRQNQDVMTPAMKPTPAAQAAVQPAAAPKAPTSPAAAPKAPTSPAAAPKAPTSPAAAPVQPQAPKIQVPGPQAPKPPSMVDPNILAAGKAKPATMAPIQQAPSAAAPQFAASTPASSPAAASDNVVGRAGSAIAPAIPGTNVQQSAKPNTTWSAVPSSSVSQAAPAKLPGKQLSILQNPLINNPIGGATSRPFNTTAYGSVSGYGRSSFNPSLGKRSSDLSAVQTLKIAFEKVAKKKEKGVAGDIAAAGAGGIAGSAGGAYLAGALKNPQIQEDIAAAAKLPAGSLKRELRQLRTAGKFALPAGIAAAALAVALRRKFNIQENT